VLMSLMMDFARQLSPLLLKSMVVVFELFYKLQSCWAILLDVLVLDDGLGSGRRFDLRLLDLLGLLRLLRLLGLLWFLWLLGLLDWLFRLLGLLDWLLDWLFLWSGLFRWSDRFFHCSCCCRCL